MNILIPHQWLLDHLDTKADPRKIQEYLSLCGPSVEKIEEIKGDSVYDIEVTTNRVDAASVRGIAREAATILPEFGVDASLKDLPFSAEGIKQELENLDKLNLDIQNNPELCHRILAVSMKVDQLEQSPQWLKDRLEQVGQRSLNLLIDVTNYVMWEIGHPIHVFDLDKLNEKKIIVRQAEKGETLVTLDKKKHTLKGGEVVFDDGTGKIVDLPGIMGTANSIVDDNTKNILIWIESVPATLIRKASMGLAIRTQAAVLNEKNVDPGLGLEALTRALDLYRTLTHAKATSKIYDEWPVKPEVKTIEITQATIDAYLGLRVEPERIERILSSLGCQVSRTDKGYRVIPPSYRAHDLEIKQDIIEEIARIYGYHNLPSKIMDTRIPDIDTNFDHHTEHAIKLSLANWGLNEVYTYSLVSEDQAKASTYDLEQHLKLKNALTDDMVYLRRSILPSHLEVFQANKAMNKWTIFEMANVYIPSPENDLPEEKLQLVISSNESYLALKQVVDKLLLELRVPEVTIIPVDKAQEDLEFVPELSAQIKSKDTSLGIIGQNQLGFYSCVLDVATLIAAHQLYPRYQAIPSTSAIIEDMTFTLPEKTHLGTIVRAIAALDPLITKVSLKDTYQANATFTINYQDFENQLSVEDIVSLREQVVAKVSKDFDGRLVGV